MSVFKREKVSPFYYAQFEIDGRRFLRSTGETTERKARSAQPRLKAEARAELAEAAAANGRLTLNQGFGRYWEEHASVKLAEGWASEAERYIERILEMVDPNLAIETVGDAEVNDFVQQWRRKGGGTYALNRALSIWRAMHNRAKKKWKQKTQVIDWADFFTDEEQRVRWLTMHEAKALLAALPAHIGLAVEWSIYTGCREAATFGLTWDHVWIDEGFATVTTKGRKKHTVWLSPQAMDVLARCERSGSLVFSRRNKRKAFDAALVKADINDFCWHDLRHTHATWLRQAGVPLEIVQRSLGHADLQMTQRYAHVADHELREALHKVPSMVAITGNVVGFLERKIKSLG